MTKWQRAVRQEIRDAGLSLLSVRSGGHHDVLKLTNGASAFSLTVSQSPRSIEQALRRVRRDLRQRINGTA